MVHHLRNVHWRDVILVGYVVHMVQKCKKKTAVIENESLVEEQHEGEEKPEATVSQVLVHAAPESPGSIYGDHGGRRTFGGTVSMAPF